MVRYGKLPFISGAAAVVTALLGSSSFAQPISDGTIHQTVHAGVMSPVFVRTLDNAVCRVHTSGVQDPSKSGKKYTDDRNIVQFQVVVDAVGSVVNLEMECWGNDGAGPVVTHSIELPAVPISEPTTSDTASLKDVPHEGLKIPALKKHELSMSDTELVARGYPARPDPIERPTEYQQWERLVSVEWTQIEPRHARHAWDEEQVHRTISSSTSLNWAGFAMTDQISCLNTVMNSPIYSYIAGQFACPVIGSGGNDGTTYRVSEWIGLGGFSDLADNRDLVQAGADATYTCAGHACMPSCDLWQEYAPDTQVKIMKGVAQPGDWIAISITMVDASGNPNRFGPNGKLGMYDWTQMVAVSANETVISKYGNYSDHPYTGRSAEWVVERVADPDCLPSGSRWCRFADFGTSTMTYAFAKVGDRDPNGVNCPYELNYLAAANKVSQIQLYNMAYATTGVRDSHGSELTLHWNSFTP